MKHTGDLEITAFNHADFVLLREVSGNLKIAAKSIARTQDWPSVFSMPMLTRVGGSLDVGHHFEAPKLLTVRDGLVVSREATLKASGLTTIGGNVELGGWSSLPHLVSIVGDLVIYNVSAPCFGDDDHADSGKDNGNCHANTQHYLPAISSINGRLSINADISLPSLTLVGRFFHIGGHKSLGSPSFASGHISSKANCPVLVTVKDSLTVVDGAELQAPSLTFVGGDVDLRTHCVLPSLSRVGGGLAIRDKARVDIPLLEFVKGTVDINGNADLSLLNQVDGNLITKSDHINLPRLTKVGGNLNAAYHIKVPSLVKIGKNLTVSFDVYFPSLQYIGGFVHRWRSAELVAPALACVAGKPYPCDQNKSYPGNLEITALNAEKFKTLTEVAGDLTIHTEIILPCLTRVAGNLVVKATANLPLLSSVGDSLITEVNIHANLPELLSVEKNCLVGFTRQWIMPNGTVPHLPKLMRVGGNLAPMKSCPMPSLSFIGGDLEVWGGEFPALCTVEGTLKISGKSDLPMLLQVGKCVHIYADIELPKLMHIGGGLRVSKRAKLPSLMIIGDNMHVSASSWLPVLREVGNGVELSASVQLPRLQRIQGSLKIGVNTKLLALVEVGGHISIRNACTATLPLLTLANGKAFAVGRFFNAKAEDFVL